MAMNIYKQGQGYWTRMMSAVGAGVLVVAAAQWAWVKLSVFIQADWAIFAQAAAALVMLGLFGLLVYRWIGVKPKTCDFLIATEGEMKKVNWPSRKEVIGATYVVIACVILLTLLLFLSDVFFFSLFEATGVIDS